MYQLSELTEEIFGHLCNVALSKCSDKFEKKRAGCGGRAMRKRVLIKNFVSDLFKLEKKSAGPATTTKSDEEYDDSADDVDYEMTDVSYYDDDDEIEEEIQIDTYHSYEPRLTNEDCWLSHAAMYRAEHTNGYYDPYSSPSPTPNGAYTTTTTIYDVYSNVSEGATEGELPAPSDPLASISSIMPPTTCATSSTTTSDATYDTYFQTHDDYFLSGVSQDVVYGLDQNFEETHELTDLDVTTGESNKNKRRSAELFEEFNMSFQKRIKI